MTSLSRDDWLACEWHEADGLGGFASGSVGGARSRRYHALLLAATTPPTGRMVLVNGLEVWLETPAGRFALSSQRYAPDVVHPDGEQRLVDFRAEPWPQWTFCCADGTEVSQEMIACHGRGDVVVRWRLLSLPGSVRLCVPPLLSGRDYHGLHHENPGFDFAAEVTGARVLWRPYPGVPAISAISDGSYRHDPLWYRNFQYDAERERGLDFTEDLASPGVFSWTLNRRDATLILSAGEASPDLDAAWLIEAEARRRRGFETPLERAADAYVVRRGAGRTIVAGYPWFTDWGRDTLIALRGFMTLPDGLELARDILLACADTVSEGMLPNRFPDSGEEPEFNAIDASLWYVVAVHEFLKAAGDTVEPAVAKALRTAAGKIVAGYRAGTRFGIRMDGDGRALASFHLRFWNEQRGCLFDVVDADHVPGRNDGSLRPNQILAVGGLPFQVLVEPYAARVVETIERELLTPLGLRSLTPGEPGYRPRFGTSVFERDSGYHQGTVWPWLMGPFVEAWLRVRDHSPEAKRKADARFLAPLREHLSVAGLGHISEVADAEPPHRPGGCPFQAWSFGELLRASRLVAEAGAEAGEPPALARRTSVA